MESCDFTGHMTSPAALVNISNGGWQNKVAGQDTLVNIGVLYLRLATVHISLAFLRAILNISKLGQTNIKTVRNDTHDAFDELMHQLRREVGIVVNHIQ